MNISHQLSRSVVLVTALLLLGGCSGLHKHGTAAAGPDAQLDRMVSAYEETSGSGGCHEIAEDNRPTVDCERIQRQVERINTEFPNNDRVSLTNAVLQMESGHMQKAQFTLDQLLARPGEHADAAVLRNQIALREGNVTLALEVANREIVLAPAHYGLREALAAAHYFDGEYRQARKQLGIARRLGAPSWRITYHEGLIEEAEGDLAAACSSYRASAHLAPGEKRSLARLIALSDTPVCDAHLQRFLPAVD